MLPKLCHLDNDLEIIIIIQYIYCVVHMTYIPYLGTFFFSRYPSVRVALARNVLGTGNGGRDIFCPKKAHLFRTVIGSPGKFCPIREREA